MLLIVEMSAETIHPRQCQVDGCNRTDTIARRYCPTHYRRWQRWGDPTICKKVQKWKVGCSVCGRKVKGHGFCTLHYQRWKKHDDPHVYLGLPQVGERASFIKDGIGYIQLSRGAWAQVDESDFHTLNTFKWQLNAHGYAYRVHEENSVRKGHLMHHDIIGKPPPGKVTDHIDRIRVNNRRSNLRLVPYYINSHNSKVSTRNKSGVKGVSWCRTTERWRAYCCIKGKHVGLGNFATKEDAIAAREHYYQKAFPLE